MKIEIKIDESCEEPRIIILTGKMTEEVSEICSRLSDGAAQPIAGFCGNSAALLRQEDIFRAYCSSGKVFAETADGEYRLRLRLYELENRLDKKVFVRISNSEIINLRKVKRFDLSLAGTICVSLTNGAVSYVSRRYVSKIKQVLGI